MKKVKINVPAKINLYLKVNEQLPNGYHNLCMVNGRLENLFDTIYIKENKTKNTIKFSHGIKIEDKDNICLKIVNDISSLYNINKKYNIYIRKRIPLGSGLGGGSMDAASIYKYILNDNNIVIPLDEQINFLMKYGSDIPYGLYDSICLVEGLGEKITPLNANIKDQAYIVLPNIYISTKQVFENYKKTNNNELDKNTILSNINNNYKEILFNDLESTSFKINNELISIKSLLDSIGKNTMSGSGSSFILFIDDRESLKLLKRTHYKVIKTFIK